MDSPEKTEKGITRGAINTGIIEMKPWPNFVRLRRDSRLHSALALARLLVVKESSGMGVDLFHVQLR
jgi:hypothetical protein